MQANCHYFVLISPKQKDTHICRTRKIMCHESICNGEGEVTKKDGLIKKGKTMDNKDILIKLMA